MAGLEFRSAIDLGKVDEMSNHHSYTGALLPSSRYYVQLLNTYDNSCQ